MKTAAYSLIEVLIAGAILAIGIAAAALLSNSIIIQQEANSDLVRALNIQPRAAALYHLGLATGTITNILPETFTTNTTPALDTFYLGFDGAATNNGIESVNCTLIIPMAAAGTNISYRTNSNTFYRGSIR